MNIVSFGGGTNSTAMIIGMYLHKSTVCQRSRLYFIPTRTETG